MLLAACGGGSDDGPAATSAVASVPPGTPQGRLETVRLHAGDATLDAEVADTPQEHQLGLMLRRRVGEDEAMLFVFSAPQQGAFWMKNTLVPLSIAYITAGPGGYRVNETLDMDPCTADPCPLYPATQPYDAALEVRQGWYTRHGVKAGGSITVDGPLPSAQP